MHLQIFAVICLAIASCYARTLGGLREEPIEIVPNPESYIDQVREDTDLRPKVSMRVINSRASGNRLLLPEHYVRIPQYHRRQLPSTIGNLQEKLDVIRPQPHAEMNFAERKRSPSINVSPVAGSEKRTRVHDPMDFDDGNAAHHEHAKQDDDDNGVNADEQDDDLSVHDGEEQSDTRDGLNDHEDLDDSEDNEDTEDQEDDEEHEDQEDEEHEDSEDHKDSEDQEDDKEPDEEKHEDVEEDK